MRVTYKPEGQSECQVWDFAPGRIRESRAEMIERRYAAALGEKQAPFELFRMAVLQGQASARRVLLWHLLSLDHPLLKIEDVDPMRDELEVEAGRTELEELRASFAAAAGLDETTRELLLANVDAQIAALDDGGGKALSNSSESATG